METNKKVVVLKSRQIGVSWLLMIYAFWCSQRYPNARILIFSKRLDDATHLMERLKFMYEHIPKAWTSYIKITEPDTRQTVGFSNGSQITALPSTPDAGRGRAAAFVLCDEHAFHPYAEKNWAAIEPAIERGTFVSVSTANGTGNLFHQIYQRSKDAANGFTRTFLGWDVHPDRDTDWYEQKTRELSKWQLNQEYPRSDTEAFVQSGDPYFDGRCCRLMSEHKTPIEMEPLPDWADSLNALPATTLKNLQLYQPPNIEHGYAIGVDPASGMSRKNDPSAVCVLDAETGDQVAEFAGNLPYDEVGYVVRLLSEIYKGLTIVERNGVGQAMIRTLMHAGVNLWHEGNMVTLMQKPKARPLFGYSTQTASKMFLLALFEEATRCEWFKLASTNLVGEMNTYERRDGATPQAAQGCHDDRIMAAALAWLAKASVSPGTKRADGGASPWSLEWWDNVIEGEARNSIDPVGSADLLWERGF